MPDISKITLPSGNTYDIKDTVAREMIAGGVTFIISNSADNTPKGITWTSGSTTITGTLEPTSAATGSFYMVPSVQSASGDIDIYDEYVVVTNGETKSWEKIGNTRINLDDLKALAYKDSVNVTITPTTTKINSVKNEGNVSGGSAASFSQGTDSFNFTANSPTVVDISKFSGGSFTRGSFNGGSGSFTQGSFNGGSFTQGTDVFSATVSNEVLTISFTQGTDSFTAATHGADSHTHTGATHSDDNFVAAEIQENFYTPGSAATASFVQGTDSFTPNIPTQVTLPTTEEKTVWNGYTSAIGS